LENLNHLSISYRSAGGEHVASAASTASPASSTSAEGVISFA
jgi:hypothetical protein